MASKDNGISKGGGNLNEELGKVIKQPSHDHSRGNARNPNVTTIYDTVKPPTRGGGNAGGGKNK